MKPPGNQRKEPFSLPLTLMKFPLKLSMVIWILMFRLLFAGIGNAVAQDQSSDNSQSDTSTQQQGPLASLSAEEKAKYLKARRQVLADHPDLKAEQEEIAKQRQGIKDASPDDRKAFLQKALAFEKKMKEAMLQIDPSLAPVFDQLEQQRKEKLQQGAGQGDGN